MCNGKSECVQSKPCSWIVLWKRTWYYEHTLTKNAAMEIQQVVRTHKSVMSRGMVLGEVISKIVSAFMPMDNKVALRNVIFDPVKPHINGFGMTLFDSVIEDTSSTSIISLDGCRWLGVTKFSKGSVESGSIFGIVKESTQFSFSGTGKNNMHDGTRCMDGTINGWGSHIRDGRIMGLAAQEEETTCMTAGLGLRQVGSITMNMQGHVTSRIAENSIRVGSSIIQQMGDGLGSGLSGGSRGKGIQGH